ncbi:uncharacterized protein LOC119315854 [Triticum dicoccoides]|uniref:uncharacterized protein LOC119315854 n=1 Tax=Triticum dicoccoides TaxID=85692 RepID=UPI0018910F2F|nr:uncharacterized protein LOC119315854 [Triticum dicoccoides]
MHNDSTRTTRLWSHAFHPCSHLIPSNHSPREILEHSSSRSCLANLAGNASRSCHRPHVSASLPYSPTTRLAQGWTTVGGRFPTPRPPVSPRDGPLSAAGRSYNRQCTGVDPGQQGATTVGRRSYNWPRRGLQVCNRRTELQARGHNRQPLVLEPTCRGAATGKRESANGHGLRRGVTVPFFLQWTVLFCYHRRQDFDATSDFSMPEHAVCLIHSGAMTNKKLVPAESNACTGKPKSWNPRHQMLLQANRKLEQRFRSSIDRRKSFNRRTKNLERAESNATTGK